MLYVYTTYIIALHLDEVSVAVISNCHVQLKLIIYNICSYLQALQCQYHIFINYGIILSFYQFIFWFPGTIMKNIIWSTFYTPTGTFVLPLYSGSEMCEGTWNQTHLLVWNFCLERLHYVTISRDRPRSNRWCQHTPGFVIHTLIYLKNNIY